MASTLLVAGTIVSVALMIGVAGYHFIARLSWVDAILNASMILTGMGPVATLESTAAKLFASGYALFSGVVFLSSVGVVLSPLLHRMMHKFHLDRQESRGSRKGEKPKGGRSEGQ